VRRHACTLPVGIHTIVRLYFAILSESVPDRARAGDHDDRVVPLHSHKLTATLQHTLTGSPDSPQTNPLVS